MRLVEAISLAVGQREGGGIFRPGSRGERYLKLLSDEAGIVKARAADIKRLALLPISVGGTAPWAAVEWAASDPPEVPGVSTHKIIHSKLHSIRLLRLGLLKLQSLSENIMRDCIVFAA